MIVEKIIREKNELEILEATLLSTEEAENLLTQDERVYKEWWWLRSPGVDSRFAADVGKYGSVLSAGDYVDNNCGAVRPVLKINCNSVFSIGDEFIFKNKGFKIISKNLAFCMEDIGHCVFREDWSADDANDYEHSDVKWYIDNWFNSETV